MTHLQITQVNTPSREGERGRERGGRREGEREREGKRGRERERRREREGEREGGREGKGYRPGYGWIEGLHVSSGDVWWVADNDISPGTLTSEGWREGEMEGLHRALDHCQPF